ncbi:MAG: succinate dehydrogenase, hydrophobic membrane anchor protein [Pseudomonadota bacterium]
MAHKGTGTFVMQRASAVLLVPLVIWFLVSVVSHAGDSFVEMKTWLSNPLVSIPFAAFVIIGSFHGRIGLSEVIVDYIHSWLRDVLLILSWIVTLGVWALAVWSVYQLSFAG